MADWVAPAELLGSLPRPVKMRGKFEFELYVIIVLMLATPAFLIVLFLADLRSSHILLTRGVHISAQVIQMACVHEKNGERLKLDYSFDAMDPVDSRFLRFQGAFFFNSPSNCVPPSHVVSLPVVYDPQDPERSTWDSDRNARLHDPGQSFRTVALFLSILPICLAALLVWAALKYRREARLLRVGVPMRAMIIDEREYSTKGGRGSELTYSFVDAQGIERTGKRSGLPTKTRDIRDIRGRYFFNTTVICDAENGALNGLYPLEAAELALR